MERSESLNDYAETLTEMILNEAMVDALHAIRRIESNRMSRILNVPAVELGNCLIEVYYSTSNAQTRDLISEFMKAAGVVWERKLSDRDTTSIASTQRQFASLSDYVELLSGDDAPLFQDQAG